MEMIPNGYQIIETEVVDAVGTKNIVTRKKVYENDEWKDRLFYRMVHTTKIENWCREHYGEPKYLGKWLCSGSYIVMDESTFIHYKLCE